MLLLLGEELIGKRNFLCVLLSFQSECNGSDCRCQQQFRNKNGKENNRFQSVGECMRDQVATIECGQFGILFKTYGNTRFKTASSNCLC